MAWWAWVLVAWSVAALVSGLVLAASLQIAARRDRARRLVDEAAESAEPDEGTGGPATAEGPGQRADRGPLRRGE